MVYVMQESYQSGVKFRSQPSLAVATIVNQWIGCQRVVYNGKVEEDKYFVAFRRKSLSLTGEFTPLDQQYSQFKSELTPWLSAVPSQVLRNGAARWMTGKQRQLKKLAGTPVKKPARGRQSVLLTKELFTFVPIDPKKPDAGHRLILGTQKFPVGEWTFHAHRAYKIPNQIVISRQAGKWYVSFSYEEVAEELLRSPEELAYELSGKTDSELVEITKAYDRGVAIRTADSDGIFYCADPVVEVRVARKKHHIKRYQRKLARQVNGSNNRRKTIQKIAALGDYKGRCAQDWAHKVSYKLVTGTTKIHVFEALNIANMTRKAKPKMVDGKWVKNGAAAKSGLNSAILASGWGRLQQFTTYKAARRNQLVITVPPHHSSQECSTCQHTHADNRKTQSEFVCQRCGHADNADTNAAHVLQKRGLAALRAGIVKKPVKQVSMRKKKQTGAGCPEVSVERSNKSCAGKTRVKRAASKQKNSGRETGSTGL